MDKVAQCEMSFPWKQVSLYFIIRTLTGVYYSSTGKGKVMLTRTGLFYFYTCLRSFDLFLINNTPEGIFN